MRTPRTVTETSIDVIFRNILEKGFNDPLILPESDSYDTVLCATIMDIDFDGENEILLGTYGQVSIYMIV